MHSLTPALDFWGLLITTKRAIAYAGAAVLAGVSFCGLLWLIPIFVWFQKPIYRTSSCPRCGSKDFRPSLVATSVDRIRVFFGIYPFRCRGCTRRFVGRIKGWFEKPEQSPQRSPAEG